MVNDISISVNSGRYEIVDGFKPTKTYTEEKLELIDVIKTSINESLGRNASTKELDRWYTFLDTGVYTLDEIPNIIRNGYSYLYTSVGSYIQDYINLLSKYNNGLITLDRLYDLTKDSDSLEAISELDTSTDIHLDELFSGISITSRYTTVPYGYSISFDPATPKIVTSTETYVVKAIVTYILTGEYRIFEFNETSYGTLDHTIDLNGRSMLYPSDITDTLDEINNYKLQYALDNHIYFTLSNGSVEDELVFQSYKKVTGCDYLINYEVIALTTMVKDNNIDSTDIDNTVAIWLINDIIGEPHITEAAREWYVDNIGTLLDSNGREVILLSSLPESECKTYISTQHETFVKSNGTSSDEMVSKGYRDVLNRDYIGSSGFEYWSNEITLKEYSQDDFNRVLAYGGIASGGNSCYNALLSAQDYLASIGEGTIDIKDSYGRVIILEIDKTNKGEGDIQCPESTSCVESLGDSADNDIVTAYSDLFDKNYITSIQFAKFRKEYDDSNLDLSGIKAVIALSTYLNNTCSYMYDKASTYLDDNDIAKDTDIYGRTIVDINSIPTSEPCIQLSILNHTIFSENDGSDEDTMVFSAYEEVLNMHYIDSIGLNYWHNDVVNNDLTYDDLCLRVAYGASVNSNPCYETRRNSVNWLMSNGYTIPDTIDIYGRIVIPYESIENKECVDYAMFINDVFVKSNGSVEDEMVFTSFSTVSGILDLLSHTVELWHNKIVDDGLTQDELNKLIAENIVNYDNTTSYNEAPRCTTSVNNAITWLTSNGFTLPISLSNGREVISKYEIDTYASDYEKSLYDENNPYVRSKDKYDDSVFEAYKDVLNRYYIREEGLDYWRNELIYKYIGNVYELKRVICLSVLTDTSLPEEILEAAQSYKDTYLVIVSIDTNGRTLVDPSELIFDEDSIDEECRQFAIANNVKYALSNDSQYDIMVFDAFKNVLDRHYISSDNLQELTSSYESSRLDQTEINAEVAYSGAAYTGGCYKAVERAVDYVKNTLKIFDGINITSRLAPVGYTLECDPEVPSEIEGTYLINYTLIHNKSTVTTTGSFQETTSKSEFLSEDEVLAMATPSELDSYNAGTSFIRIDTGEEQYMQSIYHEVLGRNLIDASGYNYWINDKTYIALNDYYDRCVLIATAAIYGTPNTDRDNAINWYNANIVDKEELPTNRYYSNSNYTVKYDPADRRETFTSTRYLVTATLTSVITGKTISGTFYEDSIVIDPFDGISVYYRDTKLSSDYSITYNPTSKKEPTYENQTYTVSATVTNLITNTTKVFTFTETVAALAAKYDVYGRPVYFDDEITNATTADLECFAYNGSSTTYVKVDYGDWKQKKVATAYSTVFGRSYIGSDGFNYWVNHDWMYNYSQDMYNVYMATTVAIPSSSTYTRCAKATTSAITYLQNLGYILDTSINKWYEEVKTYTLIKAAYDVVVKDYDNPIYTYAYKDWRDTLILVTDETRCGTGTLPAAYTSDRESFVTSLYSVYLLRAPDQSGFDYWVSDATSITTKEGMALSFLYARDHTTYFKEVMAAKAAGNFSDADVLKYLDEGTCPATDMYITRSTVVTYPDKTVHYDAVYGYVTTKKYL